MSDQPIAPEAVEAVGRAIACQLDPSVGDLDPSIPQEDIDAAAEAAIRAADKARGLRVEHKVRAAFTGPDDVEHPDETRCRLVSDWRPVDGQGQRQLAEAFIGDEATIRDTMDRLSYSQDQIDARIEALSSASVRVDSEPSEPTEAQVRAAAKAMLRVRFPNARWETTPLKRRDKMMREARETIAAYLVVVNAPSTTSEGERHGR